MVTQPVAYTLKMQMNDIQSTKCPYWVIENSNNERLSRLQSGRGLGDIPFNGGDTLDLQFTYTSTKTSNPKNLKVSAFVEFEQIGSGINNDAVPVTNVTVSSTNFYIYTAVSGLPMSPTTKPNEYQATTETPPLTFQATGQNPTYWKKTIHIQVVWDDGSISYKCDPELQIGSGQ